MMVCEETLKKLWWHRDSSTAKSPRGTLCIRKSCRLLH